MRSVWLFAALVFIATDWLALWRERPAVNYLTKPLALLFLLVWFWASAGRSWTSFWFMLGFCFSLAGDGFLLLSPRYFNFGLAAFLLAHLSYVAGLADGASLLSWRFGVAALAVTVLGIVSTSRLFKAVRTNSVHRKMTLPIILYAAAIGAMLLLAIWTLFRPEWPSDSAALVASGAALFYFSDLYLAYDRFVRPMQNARLMVRITYHLGQLALAAGVILTTTAG